MPDNRKFLLPNYEAISFDNRNNFEFKPQAGFFDPKDKEKERERERNAEQNEEDEDEVYGSHRYHYEPYDGASTSRAMTDAQEKLETLQKWSKWQDRTIHKLVKAAKGLKSQVKTLTKQVKVLTKKLAGRDSERETNEGQGDTMEIDEEQRRQSYSGPSTTLQIVEAQPRRHSVQERRRRKQRRLVRSPSPASSNPSPSLSDEEETSDSHTL